jgi:hypothetical protein
MANRGERIAHVHCTDDALVVTLADGRSISAPLAWHPHLSASRSRAGRA